jgi:glycosyltransferase involved in cell wall biosynthesis
VEHLPEEMASPLWYRFARRQEQRVVSKAALVTMNTDPGREAMQALYPDFAERFTTIRNGCDDDVMPALRRDGVFRIRFAGSIYIDRDPRLLFRAAARVVAALRLTPEQFLIEFVGEVDRYAGTSTITIAEEEGVAQYVRVGGPLRRKEVLEFLGAATVLLSLPQDSAYAIPAKIYEYMKAGAWMLVLAPPHGATARLLENTEADVLDPADVDGMARAIRLRFEQFARGELPKPVGRDGRFDRRAQSEALMNLIEGIAARHRERRR